MAGPIRESDASAAAAFFDTLAEGYDASFTDSPLGRALRPRVWRVLADSFGPGQQVLELACGTGEDAVWLAGRGVRVTATDASAAMIRQTAAKAWQAGVSARVAALQLSLQEIAGGAHPFGRERFDGALSNFGGLNTIGEWRPLAEALAGLVRPGGRLALAPLGPFCPWEIVWHAAHGRLGQSLRRFGRRATARAGTAAITVYYPSARRLRRDFAPWFRHVQTESLGLWLPPSDLQHLMVRWPGLFGRLASLEQATARLTGGWGDHYLMVLERRQAG